MKKKLLCLALCACSILTLCSCVNRNVEKDSYIIDGTWIAEREFDGETYKEEWSFDYDNINFTHSTRRGQGYNSEDKFNFDTKLEDGKHILKIDYDRLDAFVEWEYKVEDNTLYLMKDGQIYYTLEKEGV